MNRGSEAALFACRELHLIASHKGEDLPESVAKEHIVLFLGTSTR